MFKRAQKTGSCKSGRVPSRPGRLIVTWPMYTRLGTRNNARATCWSDENQENRNQAHRAYALRIMLHTHTHEIYWFFLFFDLQTCKHPVIKQNRWLRLRKRETSAINSNLGCRVGVCGCSLAKEIWLKVWSMTDVTQSKLISTKLDSTRMQNERNYSRLHEIDRNNNNKKSRTRTASGCQSRKK